MERYKIWRQQSIPDRYCQLTSATGAYNVHVPGHEQKEAVGRQPTRERVIQIVLHQQLHQRSYQARTHIVHRDCDMNVTISHNIEPTSNSKQQLQQPYLLQDKNKRCQRRQGGQ